MFQAAKPSSRQVMLSPDSPRFFFAPAHNRFGCWRQSLSLPAFMSARKKRLKTLSLPNLSPKSSTAWPLALSPLSMPSATSCPASWSDSSGVPSTSRRPSLPPPCCFSPERLSCSAFERTPDLLLRHIQLHVSVGE